MLGNAQKENKKNIGGSVNWVCNLNDKPCFGSYSQVHQYILDIIGNWVRPYKILLVKSFFSD